MVEENVLVTILFKRSLIKKTDDTIIYSYTPLEIVKGTELDFGGTKILSVPIRSISSLKGVAFNNVNEEQKRFEFAYMGDLQSSDEEYVYGFSIINRKENKEQIKNSVQSMRRDLEKIINLPIFQVLSISDLVSKFFISINDCNMNLDPESYYDLSDILYSGLYTAESGIKELLDSSKKRLQIASTNKSHYIYSDEIFDKVSKTVICQDEAIKTIATAIAKNSRLNSPTLKSNLLVCGPTGVGKTEIFRSISENFKIPIALEDSNEYTAASFKGKDVEEILIHLLNNANGDIQRAQRGLVVIDEIDKKVSGDSEHETYTTAVLNSFLKMIEGHVYRIRTSKGEIAFDTSLLTFAFSGAFSGIADLSEFKRPMGFATEEQIKQSEDIRNIYNDKSLERYGLLPEFLGRCDTIVPMHKLEVEDLEQIIVTSNKSQLLLYKYLFESMGVNFIYDDKTVEAIALKAEELGLGARSIKKIVENALAVANYYVMSTSKYRELLISPETIEDNHQYILR